MKSTYKKAAKKYHGDTVGKVNNANMPEVKAMGKGKFTNARGARTI